MEAAAAPGAQSLSSLAYEAVNDGCGCLLGWLAEIKSQITNVCIERELILALRVVLATQSGNDDATESKRRDT